MKQKPKLRRHLVFIPTQEKLEEYKHWIENECSFRPEGLSAEYWFGRGWDYELIVPSTHQRKWDIVVVHHANKLPGCCLSESMHQFNRMTHKYCWVTVKGYRNDSMVNEIISAFINEFSLSCEITIQYATFGSDGHSILCATKNEWRNERDVILYD